MTRYLVIAAALASVPAAAAAAAMPLQEFVKRGTALEKKGPLALFHKGEIRALQNEMASAGKQVREERLAAERAGRKGAYCPPANGTGGLRMGAQAFLKEMRVIAAAQPRTATTVDGMRILLAKRYPCNA